ncbi:DUF692 domain-containing protein [Paucibacter soli]|uniref:DUF692 domain-containing protein n=1 Tax=Paucibacter soli TaxID=3133433 RepID=UPI0030974735
MKQLGIGWRQPHYAQLLDLRPALGFIEVHSENFFAAGGASRQLLRDARASYALSLHGVGLSLGSACGLDAWHLERLAELVAELQPLRVSDHASFARVPLLQGAAEVSHGNDLLPIAFNEASLALMLRHVDQVQQRLGRQLLVENISAYLGWQGDTLAEPEFFNELTRRSGCGLLLDVNNLVVNALNEGDTEAQAAVRAAAWVDAISPGSVGEIHLAGYARTPALVIDDHGSRVHAPVWQVYRHALRRLGPVPSLIEWDTDVPELAVLLDEASKAQTCIDALCAVEA